MEAEGILQFPKIQDPKGNLTFLQNRDQFPFDIMRVFWTYDVPGGEIRGGHAYKCQKEMIISLSGSFDVVVIKPDGTETKYSLNRSYYGLYLPPMTWRYIENYSTNALSLHLSSHLYDPADYIRNFDAFKALANGNR